MNPTLTQEIKRLVPSSESPSELDLVIIARQIGRHPQGTVFVASRCRWGVPRVMLTMPSLDGRTPFPAIFWLTCPHLSRVVAGMESSGLMKEMKTRLENDPGYRRSFEEAEERFSRLLGELVEILDGGPLRERMGRRGIAGGEPGSIKCLHAHLAFYLVTGYGPVGRDCFTRVFESVGEYCEEEEAVCRD